MSALTKVFVLLLVVLSLVETAGIVVYVNRAQNYSAANKLSESKYKQALADAATAKDQAAQADVNRIAAEADKQNQRNLSQQVIDGQKTALLEKDTQIAQLNTNFLQATAGQKSAADALLVAQKSMDTQNTQLADMRKQNLELQKRDSENSVALIDLNNRFDTVNRQWRDATEQNAQLRHRQQSDAELMHRAGIDVNSPTLNQESLVKVEGVIKSKEVVAGTNMATISIGSADQVVRGMRLAVIDRNSPEPFLGYLFVDKVEPNSAIGHLEGPRVNLIHAGVEVRTQL